MCDAIGVMTDKEAKKLDLKGQRALRAEALRLFKTQKIQGLIPRHPIAKVIEPNAKVRIALRKRLRSKYNTLKKAAVRAGKLLKA
jgi:hypothetical protein